MALAGWSGSTSDSVVVTSERLPPVAVRSSGTDATSANGRDLSQPSKA
ncbi:MAG: hypothetical protein ABIN96_05725 [Rubrivivax sp.]